jgi:hypothetical protein
MPYELVNTATNEVMGTARISEETARTENEKLAAHHVDLKWQEHDCTVCNNTGRFDDGDRWVPCPCRG